MDDESDPVPIHKIQGFLSTKYKSLKKGRLLIVTENTKTWSVDL